MQGNTHLTRVLTNTDTSMNANMSAYQNVKGRADVSGDTSGMQDVQRKQLCNYVMGETSEMVNTV